MSRNPRDKGRLPQFVPLLVATLDSPAWRATSHGAKVLYVSLRRRVPGGRNRAYISYRMAVRELKSSNHKIREWFAELQHYGFIELAVAGCLGVDGRGKAPHWRLTELGTISKASADGLFEPPSQDFLKWDGVLFDPTPFRRAGGWDAGKIKKQNPVAPVSHTPLPPSATPPLPPSATVKIESVSPVVDIGGDESVAPVGNITSLTLLVTLWRAPPPLPNALSRSWTNESRL
jgi:hypothetical protein